MPAGLAMALSRTAIEQLATHIDDVSREWVKEYIRVRQLTMRRRKIEASGRLVDSMQFQITKSINNAVSNTIELAFEDYGRFVEMKRLNVPAGGQELIDNLAAWIEKKGFAQKFTTAFIAKRNLKTAPQNVLNQIAWGITAKRNKGYRRRVWYAKSKSAAVTDLFNRVAAGIPDIVLNELKAAFQAAS